jgi:RIO kinase 1
MATKGREKMKTRNSVFDQFTIDTLVRLMKKGLFAEDTLSPVLIGKEANVFSAEDDDGKKIIVKIYRLETSTFNKMFEYIRSDPRFSGITNNRRKIIFAWVQREFKNLIKAERLGLNVPKPIKVLNNVLLMEFIGDDYPAPELKNAYPKNTKKFCNEILDQIETFYNAGLTHGDLSMYNILNHNEKPYLIDFSHGTNKTNPIFMQLLRRDLKSMNLFFEKVKFEFSEEDFLIKLKKSSIAKRQ